MKRNYVIGIDYGTLSGRALLCDVRTGEELASSMLEYPHAVMDEYLADGKTKLPPDYALQHPQDYLDVLAATVPDVLKKASADAADVVGVGIDFTSCTLMPVLEDGTPLCFLDEYKSNPHAYVKLWKHHAAQDKANRLNAIAQARGEKWLTRYGGKISSEWVLPKIWQVLDEAPEIYEKARFIEAADWLVWQLTGRETRNSCTAGYKALWHKRDGYPAKEFFRALDPRLEDVVDQKLSRDILPLGSRAGGVSERAAALTGLAAGTSVAVANVDAHVTVPALGLHRAGQMLAIMGTSTCHVLLSDSEKMVPGMCGVVEDGILPGFYGYEAGQSCVGDHFAWFVENCVPGSYRDEAKARGIGIFRLLNEKAAALRPGESGLVALDWWNGNRSVLVDVDLTGLIAGLTLLTKPEEIYRALIEATAFGTRTIIETFNASGVPIKEFYAAGGIAEKDPLTMQIYSDIINMEIRISGSAQAPALGSAIFGAVAAGSSRGGYDSVAEASNALGRLKDVVYRPIPENAATYDRLFSEYRLLHDYFGRGGSDMMKRLKEIRRSVR
ncbi:MAG: ribulokinase [Clostridia bacterium]|nr:ribulokinase [Clostridia bacterium]MDR3644389.1 ribulokinase [Clostridia bacterium]